jgi:hypothetical protein
MEKKTVFGAINMMALIATVMVLATAGCESAPAAVPAAKTEDFSSVIDNEMVIITGYTGKAKNVTIPRQIGGLPVTGIGAEVFMSKQLTGAAIPDSVIVIGEGAFADNQLTSVTIPHSVTYIAKGVFMQNRLTKVTIPDSVGAIGEWAFAENQLTGITIPDSVTEIGKGAFGVNLLTSVTIPGSVTAIGEDAFAENRLTSITIGANVTLEGKSITGNFNTVYTGANKAAGTYTSRDGGETWRKQ